MSSPRIILGSRSPRRRELLAQVVPADRIHVLPPTNPDELGFADCSDWDAILCRLQQIVAEKGRDVLTQLSSLPLSWQAVIVADTIVAVPDGTERHSSTDWLVLGQPPDDSDWAATVASWFRDRFAGRTHRVLTAIEIITPSGQLETDVVVSHVTFRRDVEPWLDWYLSTGESRGKAGGYALQGAASAFIERVEGSLSNVIGLPLEALLRYRQLLVE